MNFNEARDWANSCWDTPANNDKEIDVDLVNAMTRLLVERVNEAVQSSKIVAARKTMADAFEADPSFREGYVANIAMLLYDRHGIRDFEERNKAASEILDLIFK